MKPIRFLLTEILYNGHLQSFGAASIFYLAFHVLYEYPMPLFLIVIPYGLFQSIFLFDRYLHISSDKKTNKERSAHLSTYYPYIPFILLSYILISLFATLISSSLAASFFYVIVLFLGLVYPIYAKGLTKHVYGFKNIYVSLVFAVMAIYPVLFGVRINSTESLIGFILYIFLESFFNQMLLDFKDITEDKKNNLLTLPVAFGVKKSLYIALFISLISYVIVILLVKEFLLLASVMLVVNLLSIFLVIRKKKSAFFLLAGKFFLWFCLWEIFNMLL